jgi:hypothetical protein
MRVRRFRRVGGTKARIVLPKVAAAKSLRAALFGKNGETARRRPTLETNREAG